jgi:hypothetical protein
MTDFNGYAVFFFPQALEALGGALKPYLQEGAEEPHVLCREVDAGGPLIQLTLDGRTTSGQHIDLQLILPTNMIRMIVSARSDPAFGFGPRTAVEPVHETSEPVVEDEPGPAHAPRAQGKPAEGTAARRKSPAKKSPAKKSAARKAANKTAGAGPAKKRAAKTPKKTAKKAAKKAARKK